MSVDGGGAGIEGRGRGMTHDRNDLQRGRCHAARQRGERAAIEHDRARRDHGAREYETKGRRHDSRGRIDVIAEMRRIARRRLRVRRAGFHCRGFGAAPDGQRVRRRWRRVLGARAGDVHAARSLKAEDRCGLQRGNLP